MRLELVRENGVEAVRRIIEPADYLKAARVPERHRTLVLSGKLEETDALPMARRLVKGEGMLLILAGLRGVGKSIAAAYALSCMYGVWVNAPELAVPPREEEGKATLDERMRKAELLVLDDVGMEHSPSGYAASRVVSAIEWREAEMKRTLVTTNLSSDEFVNRYGERIASRVEGDALGFVTCTGPDLRLARPR